MGVEGEMSTSKVAMVTGVRVTAPELEREALVLAGAMLNGVRVRAATTQPRGTELKAFNGS